MIVRINEKRCIGDETCVEICPKVFKMNGAVARAKMYEVKEELRDACQEAAESCPVAAIIIKE